MRLLRKRSTLGAYSQRVLYGTDKGYLFVASFQKNTIFLHVRKMDALAEFGKLPIWTERPVCSMYSRHHSVLGV